MRSLRGLSASTPTGNSRNQEQVAIDLRLLDEGSRWGEGLLYNGRQARFEIDWHHVRRFDLDGYLDGGRRGGRSRRERRQWRICQIGRSS